MARELEEHDRPAVLAEVGARAREDEVCAGHLRHGALVARAVREVLHQVVVRRARDRAGAEAAALRGAVDDDRLRRNLQHLRPLRHLAAERLQELGQARRRAAAVERVEDGRRRLRALLRRLLRDRLRVEEVVRLR